jgi:hypothetical protein
MSDPSSSVQSLLDGVIDYQQLSYTERVEAESALLKDFVKEYGITLLPLLKTYLGRLK